MNRAQIRLPRRTGGLATLASDLLGPVGLVLARRLSTAWRTGIDGRLPLELK